MATTHAVTQGEHITRIAKQFGFTDFRTIWNHPQNAQLRTLRDNPDVLFPGDQVFIPDKLAKEETRPTGQAHRFQLTAPTLTLQIKIEHIDFEPIGNTQCDLLVEGQVHPLTTDASGMVQVEVAETAERGNLTIKDEKVPIDIQEVLIGHLDPVSEPSGQRARLTNLGYYLDPIEGPLDEENDPELRSAIEEFQCDHMCPKGAAKNEKGLCTEVDGICGKKTQAKLLEVHGC